MLQQCLRLFDLLVLGLLLSTFDIGTDFLSGIEIFSLRRSDQKCPLNNLSVCQSCWKRSLKECRSQEKSPVYGSNNGRILEDNLQKMEVLNSEGPSSNASPFSGGDTLILSPSSRVPPKSSSSISSIFEPSSPISVLSKPSEAMMSSTESSGEYIFNSASSEYSLPDFNLCGVLSLTLL
ncbi:uncharacterized protein LOC111710743 [Eurytemora carolleeae]|uniref:uncharacterized protein LOC111710743 n=1 Tax=Eurytemora carolleeae TaxID=1294199 RepID=UPI000C78D354|nr:uncharacterized protein LOC111710743 [Eurytemora carolleeae]|eukprot:XP_023340629.1 uncharacterized protein LOC111710743 [Eurytemora affinis]